MRLRARQLHPAKIRKALRRRWFEQRLEHTLPRRAPGVVELGSDYGGWLVPAGLLGRPAAAGGRAGRSGTTDPEAPDTPAS